MEEYLYSGGQFVNVGNAWQEWQQKQLRFHFKETERDNEWITLYDASRNIWVLLPMGNGKSYYAWGGDSDWTELYDVTKSHTPMEEYFYSCGQFVNVGNAWQEWQQKQLRFHFKETERDDEWITLYDASRDIWVGLPVGGGKSYYKRSGSNWTELYDVTCFSFELIAGEAIRDRIVRCCNEALDCTGHKMGYSKNHDRYRDFISCRQELTIVKAEELTKVKTSCAMFVRAVLHWCGFLPPMGPYKSGTPMFESMGNVSCQHPAFVKNKDGNKPQPGDYFYIGNKDDGTDGHTGIFLEEKNIGHWRTAEGGGGGVGDGTLCRYVDRKIRGQYFLNDRRQLQGWFDCTKILELQYFP
ncbi:MAG: hypothetical protein KAJ73_04420 [Zetaproteobacteria bacterium]|nr:hypothetical protein [Zetaproteobacteria bacterium]